uniref:Uncharacterized protein n=1 Tax=Cacopsylla melanoneura TaxID=428564 RepID=A0A8D8RL35_9HEMI
MLFSKMSTFPPLFPSSPSPLLIYLLFSESSSSPSFSFLFFSLFKYFLFLPASSPSQNIPIPRYNTTQHNFDQFRVSFTKLGFPRLSSLLSLFPSFPKYQGFFHFQFTLS